jgi:uncharacterized protein (DUF736 family)
MSERTAFGSKVSSSGSNLNSGEVKPRRRIGALWSKITAETNEEFQAGELTVTPELQEALNAAPLDKFGNKVIKISIFENRDKQEQRHPDYRILLSRHQNNG